MRSGGFSAITALLFAIAIPARPVTLIVQPNRLDLSAAAGSTIEQDVFISTMEARDTNVKLAIESFTIDPDGYPSHRPSADLNRWIAMPVHDAVVAAGRRFILHLRLTVPENGTSWCALLIDPPPDGVAPALKVQTRVVVPIFVTAAGTESPAAKIEAVDALLVSGRDIVVRVKIRNRGNTALRGPITVSIEQDQRELASADQTDLVILPGASRIVRMDLRGRFDEVAHAAVFAFYRCGGAVEQASGKIRVMPAGARPAI